MNLKHRIELARSKDTYSNCIGFALYLLGINNPEKFINTDNPFVNYSLSNYFTKVPLLEKEGDLITFNDYSPKVKDVWHMAVVLNPNSGLCVHRNGVGSIIEYSSLDSMKKLYMLCIARFYRKN